MDGIYAAQRHIYDLTRKYYLLGRDRMIRDLAVPPGGAVLEIGCGTGRNLALIARHHRAAHLYGLDISGEMLKSAAVQMERAGASERTVLARGDACAFDSTALFGRPGFQRIVLSYTLSMIPDWRGAIDAALDALAPGGELHIVDFGQQSRLPRWFARGLRTWLMRFHVTPRADLFSYAASAAAARGISCTTRSLYRDYAWSVTLAAS